MHKRLLATILATSPKGVSQLLSRLFWPNILLFGFRNRIPDSLGPISQLLSGVRMGGADRQDGTVSFLQLSKGEILSLIRIPRNPEPKAPADSDALSIGSRFLSVRSENVQRGRAFRKHSLRDNRSLVRWLANFQTQPPPKIATEGFLERELVGSFAAPEYYTLSSQVQHALVRGAPELLQESLARNMRIVPEHGDLWTGNVLVLSSGEVRALDWEFYRPEGLDTFDFLFFTITSMATGRDPIKSFWGNLDGRGSYSEIASDNVKSFCTFSAQSAVGLGKWIPYTLFRCISRHSPLGANWSEKYPVFRAILEDWYRRDHGILG